jgi:regulator of RNase E activity RraA
MKDEERARVIGLCKGLRATDLNDGLDCCGLQDVGLVSADIRPLWRDVETFAHRLYGFAHTVRFLPTNKRAPSMPPDEYAKFMGRWYRNLASGPAAEDIRPGDVIVIDGHETETGYIGSSNSQGWINRGAVGCVTNGACRDSDELIRQRIPVYHRYTRATVRPARCEIEATMVPVNIGGVMVRPGDLVVADGDGVVVVPVEHAECVIAEARRIANSDRKGRRRLFEAAGLEQDETTAEL